MNKGSIVRNLECGRMWFNYRLRFNIKVLYLFPVLNPERVKENNASNHMVGILENMGAFAELDKLFPVNTFAGDPNPIAIAGALDANSEKLNRGKEHKVSARLKCKL